MTDHPIARAPDDNRSDPDTPALEMQPISKSFPGARALSDMSLRDKAPFDIVSAQAKETRIETVFRYANMFDRALDLMASGPIDLKP